MGWFEPTEVGEVLMPVLTYLGPFHGEISREMADQSLPSGEPLSPSRRQALARRALDYRITDAACSALSDLELELRGPNGVVIPTTHISLQDTEYLLALACDEDDVQDCGRDEESLQEPPDEFAAGMIELGLDEKLSVDDNWQRDVESDFADARGEDWEEPERTLPRYQIFVELVEPGSVPVSDRWKDDPHVRATLARWDLSDAREPNA